MSAQPLDVRVREGSALDGRGQSRGFQLCDSANATSSDDTVVETENTRGWPGSGRGGACIARKGLRRCLGGRVLCWRHRTTHARTHVHVQTNMHGRRCARTCAHTRARTVAGEHTHPGHACSSTRRQVRWAGGERPAPAGQPGPCPGFGGECRLWGRLGDGYLGLLCTSFATSRV